MNPRVLYHVARADFLERTRSYGFLLTLAAMGWLVYQTSQGNVLLKIDRYRGIFNSAWLGTMMALVTAVLLSLVGLYLVKNTLARDERTRVGQILAAAPLSNLGYTFGKALSNFAVLATMLLVLAAGSVVLQFAVGESRDFRFWSFVSPLLFIALPSLAFTAALAVLFENLPVTRSGAGNVIWFFLWTALIAVGINYPNLDFTGLGVLNRPMQEQVRALDPAGYKGGFSFSLGGGEKAEELRTFVWEGLEWTPAIVRTRLIWVAVAIALTLAAALAFQRFDPSRLQLRQTRKGKSLTEDSPPKAEIGGLIRAVAPPAPRALGLNAPAPLARSRFFGLVEGEIRLLLLGQRWWWYVGMAGCLIASFVAPEAILAPWLWPVTLWSQLGTRERRYGTAAMVFSAPSPARAQLLATYVGGMALALVAGSAGLARGLIHGDAQALGATVAGMAFVPALALTLGVWTGNGKFFESLYTAWWYIGPAHAMPGLDFIGVTTASQTPTRFLIAALALLVCAFAGRVRQTAYGFALRA